MVHWPILSRNRWLTDHFTAKAGSDGQSLFPLLRGDGAPDRDALYWHPPHPPAFQGAIRSGTYKLIEHFEGGRPGHNTSKSIERAREIHLVDVNRSCIDARRET